VAPDALVRVVDAFAASLNRGELGFGRTVAAATGRPGYDPADMLRLYIWGYLSQVRSSRHLERACVRDLEALWLLRRLAPDYRTIAACRHDNPEAIVAASAAFIQFCRESGLITGRLVAVDGTKMQAVASKKNIAGAERLARDVAHTEREIAYYLDRLDIIDEQVAQGDGDQPAHRHAFGAAIASLRRRTDQLALRQQELEGHDEKVLVFGEPEARPMGYGRAPKFPAYNLQSVVDVDSGLIVHHDVANDRLKERCTPGVQRTIHRLFDQGALDRMEARIYADPSLMVTRRCTVEHPFGTIKRMSGGGRFLTRGLRRVKAEAALSVLAYNIIHAVHAFGAQRLIPAG
jgi:transposase